MLNNPTTHTHYSQFLANELQIGPLTIPNRSFLAPMSGISDVPFRNLASQYGAGLVFSEMVACQELVTKCDEARVRAERGKAQIHVVQLAGFQTRWMSLGAKLVEANGAQMVDINMGCPAKRVTTGQSGSALMRDLDHAQRLIEAVVESVKIPVSLKMRLGWDDHSINAPELARRAQSCGVAMVSVHGRTRCQFYKGKANWELVASIKRAVDIPVVVNGDIKCSEDAFVALELSGADAIMIGRASYGAPWLPGQMAKNKLETDQANPLCNNFVQRHFNEILEYYGTIQGIRRARKHLKDYFSILFSSNRHAKTLSLQLLTSDDPRHICNLITQLFSISESEGSKP